MAATVTLSSRLEATGLGKEVWMQDVATDGTTPTAVTYNYRTLAVADTAEALDVGDIAANTVLMIRAITNNLSVDLAYVSAFSADFVIKAGEPAAVIPNPSGTIYVKNATAAQTPVYEYVLCGTT